MEMKKISREIWAQLKKKSENGLPITLTSIGEILKESYPEYSFEQFCELLNENKDKTVEIRNLPFVPNMFVIFCKQMLNIANPKNVLVPFANFQECGLFDKNMNVDFKFENKDDEKAVKMFLSINTLEDITEGKIYDMILAALPLGPFNRKFISCEIVEKCANIVSNDGYCIFTFPKRIAYENRWFEELAKKGLYCNAILDMPVGSYAPYSMVDTVIVVLSKKKSDKLFVALLSDEKVAMKVADNFLNKKESTNGHKMGVYVEGGIRCYSDYYSGVKIQNINKSLSKAYNSKMVAISEIGKVYAFNQNGNFETNENSVFVPRIGSYLVVNNEDEFQIKGQNYFQVIVNPEKVLPRFLSFFLNTEKGIRIRQLHYEGTTIKAIRSKELLKMEIPCPPMEVQSECLRTYNQLEILRGEVERLKEKLQRYPASYKNVRQEIKDINNNGDKFAQWIESLPYPIATILKRYSVTDDMMKKQETLFYFFEAYSIFEATILSAGMDKKRIDCSSLREVDLHYFEKASFGNWVMMDKKLSKLYLKLLNDKEECNKKLLLSCFHTDDENLVKLLCSKDACNVLEKASQYRNVWKGHSGITSEVLYEEHVGILDGLLRDLQKYIKDLYERIRLIRPVSLEYSNGIFSNKAEILTGSNPIFRKEKLDLIYPLDRDKLYVQIIDTGEVLELPPYFILKNSPAEVKNACYFYNRLEKESSKYVSYHYDGKPEDFEDGKTAFLCIKELLSDN